MSTTDNPYEAAYELQNKLISIDQQIADLTAERNGIAAVIEREINRGNQRPSIQGYNLIEETRTTEKRKIRLDEIRQHDPATLLCVGRFDASYVSRFISLSKDHPMLWAPDFEEHYDLKLGELDRATGGKKNSAPYVDVEIIPKTTRRISRIESPIIEV